MLAAAEGARHTETVRDCHALRLTGVAVRSVPVPESFIQLFTHSAGLGV